MAKVSKNKVKKVNVITGKGMRSKNLDKSEHNIWIYEGASYIDEFGYLEELSEISSKYSNIQFIPTCSRPDDPKNKDWNGMTGRVNDIFNNVFE